MQLTHLLSVSYLAIATFMGSTSLNAMQIDTEIDACKNITQAKTAATRYKALSAQYEAGINQANKDLQKAEDDLKTAKGVLTSIDKTDTEALLQTIVDEKVGKDTTAYIEYSKQPLKDLIGSWVDTLCGGYATQEFLTGDAKVGAKTGEEVKTALVGVVDHFNYADLDALYDNAKGEHLRAPKSGKLCDLAQAQQVHNEAYALALHDYVNNTWADDDGDRILSGTVAGVLKGDTRKAIKDSIAAGDLAL